MSFNKINKDTYNNISEDWENKRKYFWKPVVDFVNSFENKERLKFLDLGCGGGRHLELAIREGFLKKNCVGSDFSLGQLETVKAKEFSVDNSDLKKLNFEDESFDVIVCIAAHHHLLEKNEQMQSLKEMRRILKKNGKILLANWMPDEEFLKKQIEKGKFEFLDDEKKKVKVTYTDLGVGKKFDRYYYLFEKNEIISLCEEAGFVVESTNVFKGNIYLALR